MMIKILMLSQNHSHKNNKKQNLNGMNIIKIFIKWDLTQDTLLFLIKNVQIYNLQTNM